MKRTAILSFSIISMVLSAVSCISQDTGVVTGAMMCSVVSRNELLSDNGVSFEIKKDRTAGIPDGTERVMANCEITDIKKTGNNAYCAELLEFAPVTIKNPVAGRQSETDTLGHDAIDATVWLGNGYINAMVSVLKAKDSDIRHSINLEFDGSRSNSDTLFFKFRHNAFEDSPDYPGTDFSTLDIVRSYHSFRLDGLLPPHVDSIVLHIENEWFHTVGGVLTKNRTVFSGDLKYHVTP